VLGYPSVDLMAVEMEAVAAFEGKRKLARTEQLVNRSVRHLQILSQVVNRHEMTGPDSVA